MNNKIKKIIRKKNKSKIVCLTAYSKNIASILDNHCDIILVGDSLGSVLYNYKTTRNVTLNSMIEHSKSVKLGVQKSLMIVDMPYNTYRTSKLVTHAGICIGNGEFIHTSSIKGVMISKINDPYYWRKYFLFGTRIIN